MVQVVQSTLLSSITQLGVTYVRFIGTESDRHALSPIISKRIMREPTADRQHQTITFQRSIIKMETSRIIEPHQPATTVTAIKVTYIDTTNKPTF